MRTKKRLELLEKLLLGTKGSIRINEYGDIYLQKNDLNNSCEFSPNCYGMLWNLYDKKQKSPERDD